MSGTVCCYAGCKKSYSTDKDTAFFKFPDDPKRRKKWMQNSGNLELESLSERQLRGKRICSDHFTAKSFQRPESKTALNDTAIPVMAKAVPVAKPAAATPADTGVGVSPRRGSTKKAQQVEEKEKEAPTTSVIAKKSKVEPITSPTKPAEKEKAGQQQQQQSNQSPATAAAVTQSKDGEISTPKTANKRKLGAAKSSTSGQDTVAVEKLPERQLRGKRSVSDHTGKSLQTPEAKSTKSETVISTTKPADAGEGVTPRRSPAKKVQAEDKQKEIPTSPVIAKKTKVAPISSPTKPIEKDKVDPEPSSKSNATTAVTQNKANEVLTPKATNKRKLGAAKNSKSEQEIESVSESQPSGKRICAESKTAQKDTTTAVAVVAKAVSVAKPTPTAPSETGAAVSPRRSPAKKVQAEDKQKQAPVSPALAATAKNKVVPASSSPKPTEKGKVNQQQSSQKRSATSVPPQNKSNKVTTTTTSNKRKLDSAKNTETDNETATIVANQLSQMQSVFLPKQRSASKPTVQKIEISDNVSDADSYDEYMYYDRDFEETYFDDDPDGRLDREFERFYASLKKFLHLSGKWTMGGVQWDPQGKRKVIIISEPEIPPNGRPSVKRCLQFFEDKAVRVFIDGMDMTDVFGMSCYAEKEDVSSLICRVADASSCCGVPEMVEDDFVHFPEAKKRNTSYFDSKCPGVIANDSFEPMCTACKHLQELVIENRKKERQRLLERRIRSEEKEFQHPFGRALYSMFSDLVDETDPTKPRKKRTKETFFRKYLHDTRYKMDGDTSKTERVYIEKPISVDSVSASFQDIVSKLGFNMPNAKKPKTYGSALPRPSSSGMTSTPKPSRFTTGSSGLAKLERNKTPLQVEHILPFQAGSSFTLDDGQEYELIGEVDPVGTEIVEMKPTPSQQYEIIEVDDETLAKLASAKNPVVVLPDSAASAASNLQVTRIDANDPNLSQILKAINTSHGFRVN